MEHREGTLEESLQQLRHLTSTDFAAVALLDEAERMVRWVGAAGSRNNRYKRIAVRVGKGLLGKVMRSGRPWVIESFELQRGDDPSDYPILLAEDLHAFAAYPLLQKGRIVGVLLCGNRLERTFSKEVLARFEQAAHQIGADLEWKRRIG